MNASSAHALDLDAQIEAAERAVIDRDQRVRQRAVGMVQQVRAHAGRSIAIGVGGVAALFLFLRFTRGNRPRGLARAGFGAAAVTGTRRRPIAFTRLAALVWPLLPLSLRQKVSPQLMSLLGVGLPVLAGLKAAGSGVPEPSTAVNLDLPRYTGRWYEIARMPMRPEAQCESDVSASYSLQDGAIAVINECVRPDGSVAVVQGEARMTDPENAAKLEISFAPEWLRFLPFVWSDYWVLYVDADYESALVGTPDRRHLWLLSRTPALEPARLQRLLEHARLKGYDPSRLMGTPQHGGVAQERSPVQHV